MGFLSRLAEPSTHAGLAVVAGTIGTAAVTLGANPTKVGAVATVLQAIFGALAIFAPEKSAATPAVSE